MSFGNTKRNIEEPVTVPVEGINRKGETVTTHPAFGELSVSRISGRTNLFGSDFAHSSYVVIRVKDCELHRSLSNDRYFSGLRGMMELALSEAQWATFVSSFNMAGVPCTLQHVEGRGRIPELPDPKSRADQFGKEMQEDFDEALQELDDLKQAIEAATTGLSKVKQAALLKKVDTARAKLTSSAPFVADQFGEHMEEQMERAKVEIHGYANSLFQRAGVASLTGGSPVTLELEDKR